MDYLDFELRIAAGAESEYQVTVMHAPVGGDPSISTHIPVDDAELRRLVDGLSALRSAQESMRGTNVAYRGAQLASPDFTNEVDAARQIGERLFDALIVGTVRDAYASSLRRAREEGKGLRLRLRIEDPEVAMLPWECLFDPQEGDHVSLLRETPLTRYTALPRDLNVLTISPPMRILGMVASPNDLVPLDIAEEQTRIQHALEHALERGDIELTWVEGGTWEALQRALENGPWHVFHYIGHGAFDPISNTGLLAFVDDQGSTHQMSATILGRLFSGHSSLRLAFLNACEGGRISESDLFSSVGAVLTRRGIPAVISMQYPISDQAALEFARLFYDSLTRGSPVDIAVTEARTGLSIKMQNSVEWATPMLHMRAPDGRLFAVDPVAPIFDEKKPVPVADTPVSRPQGTTAPHQTVGRGAAEQPLRGLDILRRKVYQYWVEGVLKNSLYLQTLHDLGLKAAQDAVENPWGTRIEQAGESSRVLAEGQTLLDVFDEYGGSLLILGEPGSGKTTSMLELARSLHDRLQIGTNTPGGPPVPVVFNISSWSPSFAKLEDWMADQMSLQYQIPRIEGHRLLTTGAILPLLDGLDETDSAVRIQCVESINSFLLERNLTGLVVCCRLKEYSALPVRLALNTALRLTELTDEQVDEYLAAAGEQLAGLRDLLRRETAMRFDARSPLWLNLMVRAYHGLSISDLTEEGAQSAAERRRRLMNDYMARMFRRARGGAP